MATVADLLVKIGADTSDLRKELNATKRQIRSAFGEQGLSISDTALKSLVGLGAGMVALGVASVKAAAEVQNVNTALTNMLGSADKANKFVKELQQFAAKTPFEFNQVAQAAQKFLAFGFKAEQIIPTLTAVGDAAAGVGLGAEGINRITIALGQMAAKSKVQAGEMMQLTETGIPAWQMLADKIGVSVPEAMDMVTKGLVDAETGISALVGGMESTFNGLMDQQSQTIGGAWSNMMDGIEQSMAQVGLRIAETFNLTDIFSDIDTVLSNFASTVASSGIQEALATCIPPSFQYALIGISAVIVGIAAPALYLLYTSIVAMAAPFVAAAGAAAPFIAAIAAVAAGALALYRNGIGVTEILEFMGINIGNLTGLFDNLKSFVSLLGNAFVGLLNVGRPVFIGIATIAVAHFSIIMKSIGALIDFIVILVDAVISTATAVIDGFTWLAESIDYILSAVGNELMNMANSVLPDWASNGLSVISNFVNTAISWLSDLISKITETNNALGGVGTDSGGGSDAKENAPEKPEWKLPDFSNFKSAAPATGGGGGGAAKGGGGRHKDWLKDKADSINEDINNEYNRRFLSKSEAVEAWFIEEQKKLEESKAANEAYEQQKLKLQKIYADKRLEALLEEKKRETDIINSIRDAAFSNREATTGFFGSASTQELSKMQVEYEKTIASIDDRWQKLSDSYAAMNERDRATFITALEAQGIAYEKEQTGELNFTKAILEEKLAAQKKYEDDRLAYYQNCKDIQADIERAYNTLSFTDLQATLTEENAIRLSNMEATKTMMDVYEQAYRDAYITTAEIMAQAYQTALDGVGTVLSDLLMGTKTLGQAFQQVGKSILQTIIQMYAKQLAGMLAVSLFGEQQNAKSTAQTTAQAAAASAAWGPAAFLKLIVDPSSAGVASALLSSGVTASSALSMATSQAGGALGGKIKGYANGGLFTKPLYGVLGDAGDEAALPLTQNVFDRIGEGVAKSDTSQGNVVHLHVNTMDARSFQDWLSSTGGKVVKQYLYDSDREFDGISEGW